ncbi:MAG: Fe-S cluster assembly protein SufD [Chloroflexota bacterium]
MTQTITTSGLPAVTEADVEELIARGGEPQWLAERRRTAWRTYAAMDLPDPVDEEWRRTDVRAMRFDGVRLAASATPAAGDAAEGDGSLAGHIVQRDADVVSVRLDDALAARGVILCDLLTAAREHEDLLKRYLSDAVKPAEWKFVALNAALWSGGCFLYVPKGVEIALPVQLSTSVSAGGLAAFPHTIIVAEPQSKVTFIDETQSPDVAAPAFVGGAVEIYAGDGAKVEYYSINRWGQSVYNFNTVRAIAGRDAEFLGMAAGIGGKMTKMRIDTEMAQAGAQVKLLGVTFGGGEQHFDYNTLQDHVGQHTISDLQFKSALTDSASLVWYGITRINHTAGGSEANQTSRNLLLSEHAKAAPIPILEIKAHDVSKCSHGATVGPVDENELFYLQARAIPRDVAERMLVEGFFASVADRIPSAPVRARVMDAVLAKAGGGAGTLTFDEVLSAK